MIGKQKKNSFLAFKLYKEVFAVSVKRIPKVLEKQYITPIPESSEFILGVINFRGNIVPVFDLRRKFEMPSCEELDTYVIVIFDLNIHKKNQTVAAVVDVVTEVIAVDDEALTEVVEMGINYSPEFVTEAIEHNGKFINILNIDRVFESDIYHKEG